MCPKSAGKVSTVVCEFGPCNMGPGSKNGGVGALVGLGRYEPDCQMQD